MPVRNRQSTLELAVLSILRQTYARWELLIFDDGSTDATLEVARAIREPRVRLWSERRSLGLGARLNQILAHSRGDYFARMDADDVAYPERIEQQVTFLDSHSEVDLVGAWILVFGADGVPIGKRIGPVGHSGICCAPYSGFRLFHPTFTGRTKWFHRNPYNETLRRAQDQELLLRTHKSSVFANVPEILLGYREERLLLKNLVSGRLRFARAAIRSYQHSPAIVSRIVLEQAAKVLLDSVALSTGLGHRLLRHRANPLQAGEIEKWYQVWDGLHERLPSRQ